MNYQILECDNALRAQATVFRNEEASDMKVQNAWELSEDKKYTPSQANEKPTVDNAICCSFISSFQDDNFVS